MIDPFDEADNFAIYEERYNQITLTLGRWELVI